MPEVITLTGGTCPVCQRQGEVRTFPDMRGQTLHEVYRFPDKDVVKDICYWRHTKKEAVT